MDFFFSPPISFLSPSERSGETFPFSLSKTNEQIVFPEETSSSNLSKLSMVLIDDYWSGQPFPKGTCVVFGGRGFVGRSLVYRLLRLRKWIVRVADCTTSIHLDLSTQSDSVLSQAISAGCASYHCVDVRDKSQITGGNNISILQITLALNIYLNSIFIVAEMLLLFWPRLSPKTLSGAITFLFQLRMEYRMANSFLSVAQNQENLPKNLIVANPVVVCSCFW